MKILISLCKNKNNIQHTKFNSLRNVFNEEKKKKKQANEKQILRKMSTMNKRKIVNLNENFYL